MFIQDFRSMYSVQHTLGRRSFYFFRRGGGKGKSNHFTPPKKYPRGKNFWYPQGTDIYYTGRVK